MIQSKHIRKKWFKKKDFINCHKIILGNSIKLINLNVFSISLEPRWYLCIYIIYLLHYMWFNHKRV